MKYLFVFLALFSVVFEGMYSTFPLTLIVLLLYAVIKKESSMFLWAFFLGILLDIFSFRTIGMTSIFFLIFLFLILLYERKYEIATIPFILITSFIGTLLFLKLEGYHMIFLQAVMSSFIGALLFFFLQRTKLKNRNE